MNLSIKEAGIHGILGDNGAGKTTLFNIVFGTYEIENGIVEYSEKIRKNIAYLETENYFYSYMTGLEYLKLVTQFHKADVEKWNEIFELPLHQYAHTYSTGMKRKLSLLGVLLLNKELIILDEPFNGLDLKTIQVMYEVLQGLKRNGKTIILSSHILETVINQADTISFLDEGIILKDYQKEEFDQLDLFIQSRYKGNIRSMVDALLPSS